MLTIKKRLMRRRLLQQMLLPTALIALIATTANLVGLLSVPTKEVYITEPLVVGEPDISPKGFWQSIPLLIEEPPKDFLPIDAVVDVPIGMGVIEQTTILPGNDHKTVALSSGHLFNLTHHSNDEVLSIAAQPLPFDIELDSDEPQVLIYHTHGTESYDANDVGYYDPSLPSRSSDTTQNMVAVGEVMVDILNDMDINTLHDRTLHDEFSYNGSYGSSKEMVESYLEQYPSIKIVLDVHRDALERTGGYRVKPVTVIEGNKTAQVMLISGVDDGNMDMPNYLENLKFATAFQSAMESRYPTLTRSILFDYRNYNQQLSTGALLLEVGGHANTLDEAKQAAEYAAIALAEMLRGE